MQNYRDLSGNGPSGADLRTRVSRGGTITTGGSAQTLAPADAFRKNIEGQNISSGDLWINDSGGTAAVDGVGSFKIASGEVFSSRSNSALSIIGATTGQKFSVFED